jgi:hypothetical protein
LQAICPVSGFRIHGVAPPSQRASSALVPSSPIKEKLT